MSAQPLDAVPPRIVVMGVSGSGKSTIGALLAERLGAPFLDADDLHPLTNVEKMSRGLPLTDDDRWPWLGAVGAALGAAPHLVVACSALRRAYRDRIREHAPDVVFVHLDLPVEETVARVRSRSGHFMPAALIDSQMQTLEPLQPDESGATVAAVRSVEAVVEDAWHGIAVSAC